MVNGSIDESVMSFVIVFFSLIPICFCQNETENIVRNFLFLFDVFSEQTLVMVTFTSISGNTIPNPQSNPMYSL